MQVSVESISKLERRMQVQVPAERVAKEIAARLQNLSRTARLNGFRRAKLPSRSSASNSACRCIASDRRAAAIEFCRGGDREAAVAGRKSAHRTAKHDEGQDLKYTATFEVFPEVALQPMDSLEFDRVTAEVTEPDIDAMILRLRKQQMKYSPAARAAAAGDKVTIDFSGKIDGVEFAGAKARTSRSHWARDGCCRNSAGTHRRRGRRASRHHREFPSRLPRHRTRREGVAIRHGYQDGRGAVAARARRGILQGIRSHRGRSSEIARGRGRNMRRELEQNLRNRNKTAVMEKLYLANPIDVPNALLESQIRDMQVESMRRSGTKDVSQAPPREPFVEPARRRVALGLIFNDVIRRESLVLDPKRANARLDEMVGAYGDAAAMKRAYQQNADAMRQVESLALEDQVVDWILDHAKVRETPSGFKELMNFEA